MNVAPPQGQLVPVTRTNRGHLTRKRQAGEALRIASGLYIVGASLPPEQAVRSHLYAVISLFWPDAVLCGRTALAGGIPRDGVMFVAHPSPQRRTPLELPGITIVPVVGPGVLPGDVALPQYGLTMSGQARRLVENVDLQGRPARFRAGTTTVEDQIDDLARSGGAGRVQTTIDQLDVIAGSFDPYAVELVRRRLAALLGTLTDGPAPTSDRLRARLSGEPFDAHRLELLRGLVAYLSGQAPQLRPTGGPMERWEWLPFFEAYFSNFIEGTEFGVDEARRIAVEGVVPEDRPADAHDVAATYRLASDPADRVTIARSGDELSAILRHRHRILMAARPDKRPGEFKQTDNYAGGYRFVEWPLVEGTLKRGFAVLNEITDPLFRAVGMMVLVTECHPFLDGNGRVARLTANAELSVAGQARIVVPTSYRNNYLAGLSALSNGNGRGESLLAVLGFAQRWTTEVDWSDYDQTNRTLDACNAYLDPGLAEDTGQRLQLPPR